MKQYLTWNFNFIQGINQMSLPIDSVSSAIALPTEASGI